MTSSEKSASGGPLASLMGQSGEPVACKVISEDVAVHWWSTTAEAGDPCLCGTRIKQQDADDGPTD